MRGRDLAIGLAAFLGGHLAGAKLTFRLWLDLSNRSGEASALAFLVGAPKTLLFLGVVPFLIVLRTARKRLGLAGVGLPSFLSGFLWLVFYGTTASAARALLQAGQPPRLATGIAFVVLVAGVPAVLEYAVFALWAWLSSVRPASPPGAP